jgi:eukaryotic-like serine/threonine-protein kinase
MIGTRCGNWIVDEEIGANAMGRLYRAHSVDEPGRLAAIKWLTHPKAKTPEFEKLFLAQVDLLRKLKHPGVVAVLDGGVHLGSPYYAMEWIAGSNLQTLRRRGEKIDWRAALAAALQIVPALRHAHRRSVLHRDLKPSNLFRCDDGSWKIADFGVTKFFGDSLLTNSDNVLGSPAYLSPEAAAGKPHTKRSDFYALGCLLYTLIAGRPPFTGVSVVELIHKHCFVLPERLIHFVPDLPEEIDRFVMKLLAKEPGQRPGSGTLLIHEIEGIWSALERRGMVSKPPQIATPEDESDLPPEEDVGLIRLPEPIPRPPVPWQRRWYVIVPAFGICVLILLWAFVWRGPSADDLMSKARPLLASNNPDDWQTAWNEYLEPLSRKFPDKYRDEVRDAKLRIDAHGELKRAFLTGRSVRYNSEAERFYHQGLRLVQAGEYRAARRVWRNLDLVYGDFGSESDKRWVLLAREGIQRLDDQGNPIRPSGQPSLIETVQPVIDEIQRLRKAKQGEEADMLSNSLEFLYRDDPELPALRELLHGGKGAKN